MSPAEAQESADRLENLLENYVVAAFFGSEQEKAESKENLQQTTDSFWKYLEENIS